MGPRRQIKVMAGDLPGRQSTYRADSHGLAYRGTSGVWAGRYVVGWRDMQSVQHHGETVEWTPVRAVMAAVIGAILAALVAGLLAGPAVASLAGLVGAIAGLVSHIRRRQVLVAVELRDGRRGLLAVPPAVWQQAQAARF